MQSLLYVIALVALPGSVRVLCAPENEHGHTKEVVRGDQVAKVPFVFTRQTRDPENSEMQPEAKQTDDNPWPQLINGERIMSSVLAQLHKTRGGPPAPLPWSDTEGGYNRNGENERTYAEENQGGAISEYVDNSNVNWERGTRGNGRQKYYSICRTERSTVSLRDGEYEYRPAHYEEIRCITNGFNDRSEKTICSDAGFECMQWNETIHITRKRITSGCWESFTYTVPKGCECMWPEHKLGKIEMHQA